MGLVLHLWLHDTCRTYLPNKRGILIGRWRQLQRWR